MVLNSKQNCLLFNPTADSLQKLFLQGDWPFAHRALGSFPSAFSERKKPETVFKSALSLPGVLYISQAMNDLNLITLN
jgi:hypothetical protein